MLLGQENSRDIFIELVLKQQYKTFLSWCDSIESAIHVNIQMTSDPNTQVQIQTQNYHNFVHVDAMLKHAKKLSKFISFPISTFRYPISILKDKKCNHNNTLAPFCYLIGSGSWFNKFKYYSSWFFGIETFFNLILRSLLGETISKYSDIIFTPECSRSGHQKYCQHHLLWQNCVFILWSKTDLSLYQTVRSF